MKQLFLSLLLSLLVFSTSHAADSLTVTDSWIPEAPPGARVMAAYMNIQNTSINSIDIIAVSSPAFDSVEMHLSREVDGIAKMLQQDKLSVAAKSTLNADETQKASA